ncbi:MFS transporter [Pseudobacteriovorax antillogorgiicola]|uniref:Major Facilitator Superfamily protein n=1 Tax=Pseudobacteriovorax antillogorgiicola TaxID=1513793 RepID=A0A1Y6BBK1_9BACT|nr:MFS transporter [Pseudobacteriovorax antillogorgiicola]TCS57382.1 MFS transporter [Pseudobacteriovorax antillogorgiicola]SMF01804.1 Major Facilitator Superfamily protein [Pseudobacteriovorax antillogorgiicola]
MLHRLPRHYLVMMALAFLSTVTSFIFPLTAPIIMTMTKSSPTEVTLALGILGLIVGLSQPYFGSFLEKGRILAPFLLSVSGVACGLMVFVFQSSSLIMVLAGLLALNIGYGVYQTTSSIIGLGLIPSSLRETGASYFFLVVNLGLAISAVLAALFLTRWRDIMFILDLCTTLLAVFGVYFITLRKRHAITIRRTSNHTSYRLVFQTIYHHAPLMIGITLLFAGTHLAIMILPLYFEFKGLDTMRLTAYQMLLNTMIVALGTLVVGHWVDYLGRPRSACLSGLLIGSAFILIPYVEFRVIFFVYACLFSLGEVIAVRLGSAVFFDIFPEDRKGLASGTSMMIHSIARTMSPLLGLSLFHLPVATASYLLGVTFILGGTLLGYWYWSYSSEITLTSHMEHAS